MTSHDRIESRAALELLATRRRFLHRGLRLAEGLAAAALLPALPSSAEPRPSSRTLPKSTRSLLETSGLVYVSPLHVDGRESTCHGEVWFGWIDDSVVLITSRKAWKARALAKDLDRARIWVGDHGRWKRLLGRNEEFREAPHFDARATHSKDPALLEKLMRLYTTKYPEEFGDWEERMRTGFASGERWLIRYTPAS